MEVKEEEEEEEQPRRQLLSTQTNPFGRVCPQSRLQMKMELKVLHEVLHEEAPLEVVVVVVVISVVVEIAFVGWSALAVEFWGQGVDQEVVGMRELHPQHHRPLCGQA